MATNEKLNNYIQNDTVLKEKQALLDKNYQSSLQTLNANRGRSTADAKIANDRLMKYLPQILKSQGLAGNVGVTESALIDANNRLNNRLGEIESTYNSGLTALDSEYGNSKLALYTEAENRMKVEQQELEKKQLEKYNMMLSEMENWTTGYQDLYNYINQNKDALSDEQYNNLLKQAINNKPSLNETKEQADREVAIEEELDSHYIGEYGAALGLKNTDKGENFHVNREGKNYYVQVGDEYTEANSAKLLQKASDAGVENGDVFYYDGEVYLKYGEKLYRVEDQPLGGDYYDDLVAYLRIDSLEEKATKETQKPLPLANKAYG